MNDTPKVLLIVLDPVQSKYLKVLIQNFGFEVYATQRFDEGFKIVKEIKPSIVVLDSQIPGMHWNDASKKIREDNQDICILLLTHLKEMAESSHPDIAGVINTPLNYVEFRGKIMQYLNKGEAYNRLAGISAYREKEDADYIDKIILGHSKRISEVKSIIRRVAEPEVTILLRGESGTGKELAAHALYMCSKRRNKPFVKVLCAAIPEGLLESELFGHEKGAFTGAHRSKPGKFEFANEGTIFLDEIGDVPQSLQAKLLQVLQDGEFSRVGGKEVKVDVRVIAATNKNLERGVAAGTFREDLFYRLNVVGITMPPLRDRREDIIVLTEFFLHKYYQLYNKEYRPLSTGTMDSFMAYDWPGNVRELENVVKRVIVLGNENIDLSGQINNRDVKESMHPVKAETDSNMPFNSRSLKDIVQESVRKTEEEAIKKALIVCKWNKRKAAELLSISYKTLFYKMRQYNLLE